MLEAFPPEGECAHWSVTSWHGYARDRLRDYGCLRLRVNVRALRGDKRVPIRDTNKAIEGCSCNTNNNGVVECRCSG